MRRFLLMPATLLLGGCGLLGRDLPDDAPPLVDMEEPVVLLQEPDDEAQRVLLDPGVFTGLYVESSGETLEELGEEGGGVVVRSVVENSPGAAAGLAEDDLIFELTVNDADEPIVLDHASQWRELELRSRPGDVFHVIYERAGAEREAKIVVTQRIAPASRTDAARYREETKVGVVLRTATEVEARAAGLGPGAGAVVVGLSKRSPWREGGPRFEDLITQVDGREVTHPGVVIDAIRAGEPGQRLDLRVYRPGSGSIDIETVLTDRESEIASFKIPPLFNHEKDRGYSETSLLLGLLGYEETPAAWQVRFLWFITFSGGDADQLKEIQDPAEVQATPAGEKEP